MGRALQTCSHHVEVCVGVNCEAWVTGCGSPQRGASEARATVCELCNNALLQCCAWLLYFDRGRR